MKDFSSLRFEVWSDGSFDMMSIRAERKIEPTGNPELDSQVGLRYIWFVLSSHELQDLVRGKTSTAEDGYHKLSVMGDFWTFYDMEIPNRDFGNMTIPFYRAEMPRTFMKAVYRLCKKTWKLIRQGRKDAEEMGISKYDLPHRIEIEVSKKHRRHSCRLYGQGKGKCKVEFGSYKPEETQNRFYELRGRDNRFNDLVYRLKQIALNTTSGFHQTGKLIVSKDGEGFYWTVLNPRGKASLNGGLVNHGDSDKSDWSIHT